MKKYLNILKKLIAVTSALLLNLAFVPVYAASLNTLSDAMSRLKDSSGGNVLSNHTVKFTLDGTTALNAGETVVIDFDNGFDLTGFLNTETEDFDIKVASTEETIVAAGGCGASDAIEITTVNNTDKSFTFTACTSYTAEAAGSAIEVEIGTNATGGNDQVINPISTGTKLIDITAAGDTGKIAVVIVADDQFTVDATVNPTITFSLSGTSTSFGVLSSTSVTTSSPNITLTTSTNAPNGYSITLRDQGNGANPGLYSSLASYIIGSADYSYNNSADLGSVAGYGAQGSSATATIASPYNVTGNNVGGFERTAQTFASYNGTADNQTVDVILKAKVTGSTPAGNYQDTVTVIATANF